MKAIIKRLMNKIRKSSFGKAVLMLAGGTAFSQMLSIAISPIISRLFSPDDFGILSVYTSFLGIIAVFATLRYEFAIPISKDESQAANSLFLTLLSVIGVSFASFLVFQFSSKSIFRLVNAEELIPYSWLISIGILTNGIYIAFRYWAFRNRDFKSITKTTINQSIYKNTFVILWGVFKANAMGLIIGAIIGKSAGIWTLSKDVRKKKNELIEHISYRSLISIAKRYLRFPLFSSWGAILNSLGVQLPVLFLSSLYGTEVAGSYGFANRIVALPMVFIGQAIKEVFFGEGAQLAKTDPKKMLNLSRKLLKRLILVGIIPFAILFFFGPSLFSFIFGESWYDAGIYAQILAIMVFVRFISTPISSVFEILEKQITGLFLDVFRASVVILSFIIADYFSLSSSYCIIIYSISMIVVYLLGLIFAQKAIKDRIKFNDRN